MAYIVDQSLNVIQLWEDLFNFDEATLERIFTMWDLCSSKQSFADFLEEKFAKFNHRFAERAQQWDEDNWIDEPKRLLPGKQEDWNAHSIVFIGAQVWRVTLKIQTCMLSNVSTILMKNSKRQVFGKIVSCKILQFYARNFYKKEGKLEHTNSHPGYPGCEFPNLTIW